MNVDLLIKENKELMEEKQRYKEMWFTTNNSLAKYRKLEKQIKCSLEVISTVLENGIYNEHYCYIPPYRIREIDIFNKEIFYYDDETNGFTVKLYDYKKTWWLKEDRSE